jgi:predicted permease
MSWTRLPRIFRPTARAEVADELRFHVEERARELIERGMDPERALEQAERRFGPVRPIEDELVDSTRRRRQREDRAERLMNLRKDLRYTLRSLRKNPGFAATAVGTLALGVGAALAVFTVVNGVLVRPLPYNDPERITMIWTWMPEGYGLPLSSGMFNRLSEQQTRFDAIAAFRAWPYGLATAGSAESERVNGARVTAALFDVLGVRPIAGRTFTSDEAVPGGPNVVVISHDLWKRRFGGDRSAIGRQIELSGQSFTILGVMPPGFAFPRGAELPAPLQFALRTDLWTPLVFDAAAVTDFGTENLSAIGRLKESDLRPAQAEASAIMRSFLDENAPSLKTDFKLVSLADQAGKDIKGGLLILLGAVVIVLLIASANVASLLVARVSQRQRELAVRAAMGAGWGRIARQLVTENLVLSTLGCALGALIAFWMTKGMLALVPGSLPRADDIGLDWRVMAVAALVAIVAGVAFGIIVAGSVRWSHLAQALHAGDTRSAGSVSQRYGRRMLVAAEVALSLVLLIGAALLTRSFIELQRVRAGFNPGNVLTAGVGIPIAGRFDPSLGPIWAQRLNDVSARLNAAPGVVGAGAISSLPLTGGVEYGGVHVMGDPIPQPGEMRTAQYNVVTGRYFETMSIAVLHGRAFDSRDDAPAVRTIVVNRAFARQRFTSEDAAVGRNVRATFEFTANPAPRMIVGVVDDVKQFALDDEPTPQVYVPQSQLPYPRLAFVVRTDGSRLTALGAVSLVRRAVHDADRGALITDVRTMDDVVSQSLARQRFSMTLIGTFASLALILTIVGLYGVLSLAVRQRQREIGVRLALGAQPRNVVAMVVADGARVAAVGMLVGIAGAIAATRVLASLLYGVSTTDAMTFVGAAAVVAVVALAATYVPARRAAEVDLREALTAD